MLSDFEEFAAGGTSGVMVASGCCVARMRLRHWVLATAVMCAAWLPTNVRADDGDPDTAFGGQGSSYFGWSFPPSTVAQDEATAVLTLADGRVVLIGTIYTPDGPRLGIARLTSAGGFDPTFGDMATPGQHVIAFSGAEGEYPSAAGAAFDRDGSIVVVGQVYWYSPGYHAQIAVWKLTFDGQDDAAFAQGGQLRIDRGGANPVESGQAIAVRPTGPSTTEYLIAGVVTDAHAAPAAFVVGSNGSLVDRGATQLISGPFSGKHYFRADTTAVCAPDAAGQGQFNAIAIAAGGEIYAAGTQQCGALPDFVLATRLDPVTGEPLAGFGSAGYARVTYGVPSTAWRSAGQALAVDATGRLVIAGLATFLPTARRIGVSRLTSSGALDPAFGGTGRVVVFVHACGGTCNMNSVKGVAVERDGDIFALGDFVDADLYYPTLARLRPNGMRNTSFVDANINDPGVRAYPFPSESHSHRALALAREIGEKEPSDRLVIAGQVFDGGAYPGNYYFAVRKLLDEGIFASDLEAPP